MSSMLSTVKPAFRFKRYQREDLARAALMDGAILSWDQGLGKTIAAFIWPQLKQARRVLIVSPGSLHRQTTAEGKSKFGIETQIITDQADALKLLTSPLPAPGSTPSFHIISYQALGFNGADEWPARVNQSTGEEYINRDTIARRSVALQTAGLEPTPENLEHYFATIGEEKLFPSTLNPQLSAFPIRCTHAPTVARILSGYFDCVVIDEGVRLKATESFISQGVRTLSPRFRLVLTGTPIKNILDDVFWLAQWVCGGHAEPTARWPYENTEKAKSRFAAEHLLTERNITKEEEYKARTGISKRFVKRTPKICNIHRLWKLFGPVIIRRRKDDCGEDIAPKRFVPLRIRPGTAQQAVYTRLVQNKPIASKNGDPVKGTAKVAMQLQLLREAALCPDSPNLAQAILGDSSSQLSTLNPQPSGPRRSWTDFTPKSAAMFTLIADLVSTGEQVVVMSPFQHFSRAFARRLQEAGVSHALLDGSVRPELRGETAAEFKARKFAVLIAGIESMSEGHSFEQCANLIMPSLVWAMDKNLQAIDRVHRLTSKRPVTIYTFVTENTVDVLLESRFQEKKDSAQLAIDGRLFADDQKEINLAELLNEAITNFDPTAPTFDERQIDSEWDATLKHRLRRAEGSFREWHPPLIEGQGVTAADIAVEAEILSTLHAPAADLPAPTSPLQAALARLRAL